MKPHIKICCIASYYDDVCSGVRTEGKLDRQKLDI